MRALLLAAVFGLAVGKRTQPDVDVADGASGAVHLATVDLEEAPGHRADARDGGSSAPLAATSRGAALAESRKRRARARVAALEKRLEKARSVLALADSEAPSSGLGVEYEWDYALRQKSGSGWCWLASVVEDLRRTGALQNLFQKCVKVKESDCGGEICYSWSTCAGYQGKFELPYSEKTPMWQFLLESILMNYHGPTSGSKKDLLNFQDYTKPLMGGRDRGKEIKKMFSFINDGITVKADDLHVTTSTLTQNDLNEFLGSFSGNPHVAYVVEKKTGASHAIAVTGVQGNKLSTFNQQNRYVNEYDDDYPADVYTVRPTGGGRSKGTCTSEKRNNCDALWRIVFHGI